MKITCMDKQVGQFLKESFYRIPRFQRPYSWDRTNIEDFWNDTIKENDEQYFIGNFVVYNDSTALGVVDGQQRLTTITLLLCALRNSFQKEGFPDLAKGLHGLIERRDISDKLFYVLQTETSYPYFQEHIQRFGGKNMVPVEAGPEEQLLKQAFAFFESNLKELARNIQSKPSTSDKKKKAELRAELTRVRDKVLNLKLIFTSLDNDDDAYIIFETLNTRGKDLTLSDLVKGHLTRLLRPANSGVDLTRDKWEEILETFENSQADLNVSTFIHHFWLSRYEYITEKTLYKALRKQITKTNAKSFLDDLLKESKIYRYIHEPSSRSWKKEEFEIRDALKAMNLFKIKQQLPLVLSVMRHYEDQELKVKNVRTILQAIENFHFVFTAIASQRSSGGISFMYALAARELYKALGLEAKSKVLLDFQKHKLKAKLPPYTEFEPRFVELAYSSKTTKQKNLVKYVLLKIYHANSSGLAADPDQMTIEHISPENPLKKGGLTAEQTASIGNLILLNQDLNNKVANKSFNEKKAIFKSCHVWIDPVIIDAPQWGTDEVASRTKALAENAYQKVWVV